LSKKFNLVFCRALFCINPIANPVSQLSLLFI
jgi:hypothetical protein